jgi:hypothetical protein
MAMFINGWSIDESTESFEKLAKVAFKRRKVLDIPFLSCIYEILKSYLADGLYPAENIEVALQAVFGKDKTILDYSHATSIGARVGLPVATIREPSSCIFTNYNGVGTRDPNQGKSLRIIPVYQTNQQQDTTLYGRRTAMGECHFGKCK